MEEATTYSEKSFSDTFDRSKLRGVGAKAELKIKTSSHWDEVLPHEYIPPSSNPHFFPKMIIPLNVNYTHENNQRSLEEYMSNYNIAGLMVLRNDEIIFENYRYGLNSESRYNLWSATKSFTSTIVGMALYDGDIPSLDVLTKDYAPQFEGTAYGYAVDMLRCKYYRNNVDNCGLCMKVCGVATSEGEEEAKKVVADRR